MYLRTSQSRGMGDAAYLPAPSGISLSNSGTLMAIAGAAILLLAPGAWKLGGAGLIAYSFMRGVA